MPHKFKRRGINYIICLWYFFGLFLSTYGDIYYKSLGNVYNQWITVKLWNISRDKCYYDPWPPSPPPHVKVGHK